MLHTIILALAVATPRVHTAPPQSIQSGLGTLTLTRHDRSYDGGDKRCAAILVAPDTVLTAATCFDAMRYDGQAPSLIDFDATFSPAMGAPAGTVAVQGFDLHPGFTAIDCKSSDFRVECDRATSMCSRRFRGIYQRICLDSLAFYARSYLTRPSHNIAVVYLSRSMPEAPIGLLTSADMALSPQQPLLLVQTLGETVNTVALRRSPFEFMLNYEELMRRGTVVMQGQADGSLALVGLPSHFSMLPFEGEVPLDYTFTRLDVALDWVDGVMARAYVDGRRPEATRIRRVTPPPGDAAPEPVPDPQPAPQPAPAPRPDPAPVPKPTPQPNPAPAPAPAPTPKPSPEPAPGPEPKPDPAPPVPQPAPAPQPDPMPAPGPTPSPAPLPAPTRPPEPAPLPAPTPQPEPAPIPSPAPQVPGNEVGTHDENRSRTSPQGCGGGTGTLTAMLFTLPFATRRWRWKRL